MNITFSSAKLRRMCEDRNKLERKHGATRAALVMRRLVQLAAACALEDLRHAPGLRLHQHTRLKGQEHAVFSVDLDGGYRMLFTAAHEPEPRLPGGGADWGRITDIDIVAIEDPHG